MGGPRSVQAQPVTGGAQVLSQTGELPLSTHALDARRYVSQGRELFELRAMPPVAVPPPPSTPSVSCS